MPLPRRLEHLQKLYERGEVARIAWLDTLPLDYIQGVQSQVIIICGSALAAQ